MGITQFESWIISKKHAKNIKIPEPPNPQLSLSWNPVHKIYPVWSPIVMSRHNLHMIHMVFRRLALKYQDQCGICKEKHSTQQRFLENNIQRYAKIKSHAKRFKPSGFCWPMLSFFNDFFAELGPGEHPKTLVPTSQGFAEQMQKTLQIIQFL